MWKSWAYAYAGLILLLTLMPGPAVMGPPEDLPSAFCLICGDRGGGDGILNVLFFVPLGFALMAASGRPLGAAALVLGMTLSIELLQGVIPGRYATVGDVVFNVVGGSIGIGLAATRTRLLDPAPRLAAALSLGTGAGAGSIFFITGVLLAPSFPSTVYHGQWTADLHSLAAYEGRVLETTVGPMALGSARASQPERAVALLREGAPVRVRAVAGPAPPALAPIFSIFDEARSMILILGADGADLVVRLRYRADDVKLDRPDLFVRGGLAGVRPGDTLSLEAGPAPGGYALSVDGSRHAPLRHTPGEGWALLLHPEGTTAWVDATLDATWIVALLVLAGWWAPSVAWAVGAVTLALTGMIMAAVAGPLTGVAAAEIVAALGGVGLGLVLAALHPRRVARYRAEMLVWGKAKPGNGTVITTGANRGTLNG